MTACPTPYKKSYRSKAEAQRGQRRIRMPSGRKERCYPYQCVAGHWHLTHYTPDEQAWTSERIRRKQLMKQPISRQLVQRLEVEIDKAVDLMPDDAVEREDIQVAMSVFVAAGSELVRLAQVEILRDAIARDQASIQEARAQIERLQAEAIR